MPWQEETVFIGWVKDGLFPMSFVRQVFTNQEGSTGILYLTCRDTTLGLSLNLNMTTADVVRGADLIPLYKRAGVDYIVMGIETLNDDVATNIRKNNPFEISKQAVRLLRELDPDILNAMYLTPHFWTAQGRSTNARDVIQTDLDKWSYRNQVPATRYLKPSSYFWGLS